MFHDMKDPTTALFLSEREAQKVGHKVMEKYPDRVVRTKPKLRTSRGEALGYALVIYFKDHRPPSPITNSDVERLSVGSI